MAFIKQFLVTQSAKRIFADWQHIQINEYYFELHPDLQYALSENENQTILILGDVYDYRNIDYTNKNIVEEILNKSNSFNQIIAATDSLCGVFLLFYFDKTTLSLKVLGDATTQRELYYLNAENAFVMGSTPNIIDKYQKLEEITDSLDANFFQSEFFKKKRCYILEKTEYQNLYKLLPNYYLDVNKKQVFRFFPNQKREILPLDLATRKGAEIIKNNILAVYKRYPLLIPVSAGWDSRLILAASKTIKNKVKYFVLKTQNKTENHYDIKIPKELMKRLGVAFDIVDYSKKITEEQLRRTQLSIPYPRESVLEYAVNFFKKNYPDHCVLNGNIIEITRRYYDDIFLLNAKKVSLIEDYPKSRYAIKEYEKWMKNNAATVKKNNYDLLDIIFWEEDCGNWVAKSRTELRSFGMEVYSPFNCRELIVTLNSTPKRYRIKENPVIYKKMTDILWKEVMQLPVNPTRKKRAIALAKQLKIYAFFRNAKINWQLFNAQSKP